MHFKVQMIVRLDEPLVTDVSDNLDGQDLHESTGYLIVIGVNAPDVVTAVEQAHQVALKTKQSDGTFRSFDGVVEEAEAVRIEKEDWDPYILEHAGNIDESGVYYSTSLIFFNHADDEPEKRWWQFWR